MIYKLGTQPPTDLQFRNTLVNKSGTHTLLVWQNQTIDSFFNTENEQKHMFLLTCSDNCMRQTEFTCFRQVRKHFISLHWLFTAPQHRSSSISWCLHLNTSLWLRYRPAFFLLIQLAKLFLLFQNTSELSKRFYIFYLKKEKKEKKGQYNCCALHCLPCPVWILCLLRSGCPAPRVTAGFTLTFFIIRLRLVVIP